MKVEKLKGIGPKKKAILNKMGVMDSQDMLYYFPRGYEDRSTLYSLSDISKEGNYLLRLTIKEEGHLRFFKGRKSILTLSGMDHTQTCKIIFFNQHYLKNKLKKGQTYYFYGKLILNKGQKEIQNPIMNPLLKDDLGRLVPVYPLTKGMTQRDFRKAMDHAIKDTKIPNIIPEEIRLSENLLERKFAFQQVHFPDNKTYQLAGKRTLIFEELLVTQLGMKLIQKGQKREGYSFQYKKEIDEFIEGLDYQLTGAQERVLRELFEDMEKPLAMNRLIQGDVGSGKTIIAVIALYLCALNEKQGAYMAPTEILANQHYETMAKVFEHLGVRVALLTGSLGRKEKERIIKDLEKGEIDVLIGTHAILEENVKFRELGLVITDEQHRFGVRQRAIISSKGKYPDTLVMTATPIPRTLSLVFYGDLDISSIDELPPGRIPIDTFAVPMTMEERVFDFVKKELNQGKQVYIVCPFIEKNDNLPLKSIEEMEPYLKKAFSEYRISVLHGKMKPGEKNRVMEDFKEGKSNLLLATTVIEVGINVPNATLMLIYNGERFGLSQLHQLRGRVGRGGDKSYCILFYTGRTLNSRERMRIMQRSTDGFELAEKDLELRGEGDLFGTSQSGLPPFKIANPYTNREMIEKISNICNTILDKKLLSKEGYELLNEEVHLFIEKVNQNIILN